MNDISIEPVVPEQVAEVIELFAREVYPGSREDAEQHFGDHLSGGGDSFLARVDGRLAGYVTIRWQSHNAAFGEAGIPLIHHLAVFEQYQRRGIATMLMDAAEKLIADRSTYAGITVGLFDSYGPAQRLYARRGYIPDGRGACQAHRPLRLGESVVVGHDLIIWMTKELAASMPQD